MKALERLTDAQLLPLALATNLPGPPQKLAPRFWGGYLADVVAVEVAHRKGMNDVEEPAFPMSLASEELENGALALLAMAGEAEGDDAGLAAALREVAAGVAAILRDRLLAAGPSH